MGREVGRSHRRPSGTAGGPRVKIEEGVRLGD